jgi:hypothetical protein
MEELCGAFLHPAIPIDTSNNLKFNRLRRVEPTTTARLNDFRATVTFPGPPIGRPRPRSAVALPSLTPSSLSSLPLAPVSPRGKGPRAHLGLPAGRFGARAHGARRSEKRRVREEGGGGGSSSSSRPCCSAVQRSRRRRATAPPNAAREGGRVISLRN